LRDAQPIDEFDVPKDPVETNVLLTAFQKMLLQSLEDLRSDVQAISNSQSQTENLKAENLAFFEATMKRSLKFKLDETGDISAMNLALSSMELSVSVAAVYISKLRTFTSPLSVSKATWRAFLQESLIARIQWKERANDTRFGYGRLINFVSIFGGEFDNNFIFFLCIFGIYVN